MGDPEVVHHHGDLALAGRQQAVREAHSGAPQGRKAIPDLGARHGLTVHEQRPLAALHLHRSVQPCRPGARLRVDRWGELSGEVLLTAVRPDKAQHGCKAGLRLRETQLEPLPTRAPAADEGVVPPRAGEGAEGDAEGDLEGTTRLRLQGLADTRKALEVNQDPRVGVLDPAADVAHLRAGPPRLGVARCALAALRRAADAVALAGLLPLRHAPAIDAVLVLHASPAAVEVAKLPGLRFSARHDRSPLHGSPLHQGGLHQDSHRARQLVLVHVLPLEQAGRPRVEDHGHRLLPSVDERDSRHGRSLELLRKLCELFLLLGAPLLLLLILPVLLILVLPRLQAVLQRP
mmetsp:Transcript_97101/g.290084  ORF Transcript_97101/g.290084 Transcript_97101/m.290084 type:complete len:347 (-) Transcript_97101:336-1376(-)